MAGMAILVTGGAGYIGSHAVLALKDAGISDYTIWHDPESNALFGILTRMNLLPPAPEAIQDQEFTVEYVSPIATAQKQQAAAGIRAASEPAGAQEISP